MDFEKFTERARGFIQSAQSFALSSSHQLFTPEHLLKILLDDEEGMASSLIRAAGGRPQEVKQAVELALSAPHLPEYPFGEFKGTSDAGPYGDVVREIDSIVGMLLDKLNELGLDRDTVVLFTSDNGPWFEGSSTPLRDRKGGTAYDGGYRVPFVAWAPGRIEATQRSADRMSRRGSDEGVRNLSIGPVAVWCSLAEGCNDRVQ
jgi:hypothetical protein